MRPLSGLVLGGLLALPFFLALACAGLAYAVPIEGGTSDDVQPPGWCSCA